MQIVSDGQNLNNMLTRRPSVRQSRLFREKESGNTMKNLLGQSHLNWDVTKTQGAFNSPVYDHNKPSGYDKVVKINQTLQKPTVVRKKEPNAASMNSRRSHRLDKGHSGCSGSLWENSESQKDTNSVGHNKHKRNDYNTQTHESDAKPDVFIIDRKRDYELSVQKSTSHQSLLSTRPW
eukprot:g1347.t1